MAEFKPNKRVFLIFRFLWSSLAALGIFIIIGIILNILLNPLVWVPLLIIFIITRIYSYIALNVRHQKEKYIFTKDKIIKKEGGLFSDSETELNIKNITNVELILPLIEHWRFKTGHIKIESAGSGGTEVRLLSIDQPLDVYHVIADLMKQKGFSLKKNNLIQEESPHILGVLFESIKVFTGIVFAIFIVAINMVGASLAFLNAYLLLAALGMFFLLLGVLLYSMFVFFDLKNRVYQVYSDVITYKEGFLTKHYAFIPIENLADSYSTQTVVDRIFGLYDVKISSQGAGQEITFKNMANGKKLEENLDKLINSKQSIARKESKTTAQAKKEVKTPKLQRKTSYTNQFQMDMTRTLFPVFILMVVLFPLIIIWAIMLIPLIIKVSATKYFVKKSSMEESYEFLSAKSKEFTNEKITAVIVRENILDKLFNTMTIDFWSIGSSEHISFQNIKKSPEIVDAVTAKTGIIKQDMLQEMNSAFSIQKMIFAVLPLNFIIFCIILAGFVLSILHPLFLAIPILTIMVLLIIIVYNTEYYKRSRLTFYKDYLHFKRGLLFKDNFFVLYNNIKDIKTKKHPVSGAGSIKFNIAGVHMQGHGNQKALVSNSFKINYIDDIAVKDDLIDYTLYNRPDKSTLLQAKKNIQSIRAQTIHHTKPALINPLFILLVFSVIIFPLILLLPLTLPLLVLHIRAKSYIIEDYRALARAGIVYKTQTSIVFSKIDHLNTTQNFLNKMFKNGNVIINTAGSQMPELVISNIPDYRNFYEILNRYY